MTPLRVVSLFDGIACGSIALRNLGIPVESYKASEIDPNAIKVVKEKWSNIEQIGDVTKVNIPEGTCDLLMAGSPCQGFSLAGKKLNFDDPRSKLFFEFVRILKECKPRFFFLENNKMKKEHSDIITETLGVQPVKIDAALVSAQHRERLYWTNIPNVTVPTDKGIMLKDLVGDYDGIHVYPRGFNKGGLKSYKGKCPTITISAWEHNFFLVKNGIKVQFTSEQAEMIQGLPIGYTECLSRSQRFKRIGNGWSIPVIEHLFSGLKSA
jgi:DNA (cytosine-5)-methyltransferase 3A